MHLQSNQLDVAKACFTRALETSSLLKENVLAADASIELGGIEIYGTGEDLLHAVKRFSNAKSIYSSISNSQGLADALYGLGVAYRRLRNCPEAQTALIEARDIYTELDSQPALARTLHLLGMVLFDQTDAHKAIGPVKKALDLYKRLENKSDYADASYYLGHIYHRQRNFNSAVQYWLEAKRIYAATGAKGFLANTSYCLGKAHLAKKKVKEAKTFFQIALNNYRLENDSNGIKKAQGKLGAIDPALKRRFEAEQLLATYTTSQTGDLNSSEELIFDIKHHANGGFGDIFLGWHKTFGPVALKLPRLGPDESKHSDKIRQFKREAKIWEQLQHDHLLKFIGTLEQHGRFYLLRETADAITYLHGEKVIHGDIKGDNILISSSGSALLCDFGLSKKEGSYTSSGQKGAGSTPWTSPEVLSGATRGTQSDIYAFGITIAEILAGKPPFWHMNDHAIIIAVTHHDQRPLQLTESFGGRSYEAIWDIARDCWKRDPSERIRIADAGQRLRDADTN
ncbi:hypothetical protein FRC00_006726 [Tulasnella sp. 408]|nr:hypothetical protein FRC00_006726 [Tulasnella sp. 408]